MAYRRIAHLSDLHIGAGNDAAAERLVEAVLRSGADFVALTGDVTHRGRRSELERFRRIFAPLLTAGRLVLVPGNHDRLGDDLEPELMPGPRVQIERGAGLWMVRFNSTGRHNRFWLDCHGLLTPADLEAIVAALDAAPPHCSRVLLLHHHPLPLPEEDFFEKLVTLLGWPNAAELPLGLQLTHRLRGRCDLILHGHKHAPAEAYPFSQDARPLRVVSGGSSTALQSFRVLELDAGVRGTEWVRTGGGDPASAPVIVPQAA